MLDAGGNAFDAVLAALLAACTAEPLLASLGGGGFLLARSADGRVGVYDFFAQTPHRRPSPGDDLDFYPIHGDFGTTRQEFHIGLGSIACPGVIRALFDVQRDLATLPLSELAAPAIRLAREGLAINAMQAQILSILRPILEASEAMGRLFLSQGRSPQDDEPTLLEEGDHFANPDLASFLEELSRQDAKWFYQGEPAQLLARDFRAGGGLLTLEDLQTYQVERREPLRFRYQGARIATNPAPSSGGTLIAFGLGLLENALQSSQGAAQPQGRPGDLRHLRALVETMVLTQRARDEVLRDPEDLSLHHVLEDPHLARYQELLRKHLSSTRGTTQISAADAQGNLASLTVSNGEGSGYVLPGTGILMNNMLGEEDLNPEGFHRWPGGSRLSSMMAPTLARTTDERLIVLGSGGSNRLRTAILQVLTRVLGFGNSLEEAVQAPRLHFESGALQIEPGFSPEVLEELCRLYPRHVTWNARNLFFGGVHAVTLDPASGSFSAAADDRRGGAVASTETP